MAVRKFLFLDSATGQYKEQTGSDTIQVANGVAALDAVNRGQLDDAITAASSSASAEQARALAAEAVLQAAIDAEEARALAAEDSLRNDLNAEIARATAAEQAIASDLADEIADRTAAVAAEAAARAAAVSAEQTRAEAEEASLRADLNTEISDRQAAVSAEAAARAAAVSAEQTRAEAAEADLASDLADEIAARIAADSAEASARAAAVTAEQTRALAAEAGLQAEIDAEEAARAAAVSAEEAARIAAVSAEQTARIADVADLQSQINTEASTRAAAVSAEQARAEAAESGLDARLDTLEGNDATVNSVRYLIKNAQTSLQSAIDSEAATRAAADAALDADIAAEAARALAAEGVLAADLASEAARAAAAEAGLASDIDAEETARIAADAVHTTAINSEVSRAQAAEAILTADLASEVSRATAAEAAIAADLVTETAARAAGDAATLAAAQLYADGLSTGLKFKDSVVVAFPTSFTMAGPGGEGSVSVSLPDDFGDIVGLTDLEAGDRVLLISPDEATGAVDSGIYVVASGGTSIVRAPDMALASDASGAYVYVEQGDFTPGSVAKAVGTAYVCSSQKGSDIVGSGALKWAIFSRMENLTFGMAFTQTGQQIDLVAKADGAIAISASGLAVKIADPDHLTTGNDGLMLVGDLVNGPTGFADAEHSHSVIGFAANFLTAADAFVRADGTNATWNSADVLGYCKATFDGKSLIALSGVVESTAASAFAAGDTLYVNGAGTGFAAFGDVPSGKFAIPVAKKIDGTKIFISLGSAILKA